MNKLKFTSILLLFVLFFLFKGLVFSWNKCSSQHKAVPFARNYTIIIDPGHGGSDPGACLDKITEKQLNMGVGHYLSLILQKAGFKTKLTRNKDRYISLKNRSKYTDKSMGDVFISLHHNSTDGRVNGPESIIFYNLLDSGFSKDLAQCIKTEMDCFIKNIKPKILSVYSNSNRSKNSNDPNASNKPKASNTPDASIEPGGYFVLRNSSCPAVLTEAFYMDDPKVNAYINSPLGAWKEAAAIAGGIFKAFNNLNGRKPLFSIPHQPVENLLNNKFGQTFNLKKSIFDKQNNLYKQSSPIAKNRINTLMINLDVPVEIFKRVKSVLMLNQSLKKNNNHNSFCQNTSFCQNSSIFANSSIFLTSSNKMTQRQIIFTENTYHFKAFINIIADKNKKIINIEHYHNSKNGRKLALCVQKKLEERGRKVKIQKGSSIYTSSTRSAALVLKFPESSFLEKDIISTVFSLCSSCD